jgi:hypothetical protein
MTIVVLGAIGIVVLYERLRGAERRSPKRGGGLSGTARFLIVGVLAFIVLYVLILALTGQSQT